jgi:hypothetical protein
MADNNALMPGNIDFAQFTASLLSQTLDAIISAQLEQEEKVRRLQESAGLSPSLFAAEMITAEDGESEITRLFPAGQYPQGLLPGAPYIPAGKDRAEDPPVRDRTGYVMTGGDWKSGRITELGHNNILSSVRILLAAARLTGINGMIRRGIPRIMVDHGRINTKLTFQLSSSSDSGSSPLKTGMPLRLMVRPADLRRPEVSRLTVNVLGEVDITFKTVSE